MLGAIKYIKSYTKGVEYSGFLKNRMLMDAVIRNLEIVGEAASKLTTAFREEHSEIEWRKIIGMRNRIIHTYDMVDPEIVWDVVKHDLPELSKRLRKLAG
ncbi:MAG: DUF86 domain-containing protein [Nitrospirae bacterium]|nr:DUF86 domain-containing protein [Nitrospirota bacterium]